MFLSFVSFYRNFIQNFSRIAKPQILIFQTIEIANDQIRSTRVNKNKKNRDVPSTVSGVRGNSSVSSNIDESIKNLSTIAKSTKSKKLYLVKSKESNLIKQQKSILTKPNKSDLQNNFAKTLLGMEFLILEAKKAFIYLLKSFIKALILRHFNPKCHICIITNIL